MIHCFYFALSIMTVIGATGCHRNVEIIAHRGASYLAPENTVASVMLAWDEKADAAEIDIHLSKDNQIIVIHDDSTKRTSGIDLEVKDVTMAELRKLDVGSFKNAKYANERIPFFEEILSTIPDQKRLFVEVKCGTEILPLLKNTITESGKQKQIVIIGFDLKTMAASKTLMPSIPTYWLVATETDKKTNKQLPHNPQLIQIARDNGLDGLDVDFAGVTKEFVATAKSADQRLYVWTVDDIDEAKRLTRLGISGITTNQPGSIRKLLLSDH